MKDVRVKLSEFIASLIRDELEDNGINCVDDQALGKFERKIKKLIATNLEELKIEDKHLDIEY